MAGQRPTDLMRFLFSARYPRQLFVLMPMLSAAARICCDGAPHRSAEGPLGQISPCGDGATVISVTIRHKGLAGRRAVSANRRTWSGVDPAKLRLRQKMSCQGVVPECRAT